MKPPTLAFLVLSFAACEAPATHPASTISPPGLSSPATPAPGQRARDDAIPSNVDVVIIEPTLPSSGEPSPSSRDRAIMDMLRQTQRNSARDEPPAGALSPQMQAEARASLPAMQEALERLIPRIMTSEQFQKALTNAVTENEKGP